MIDHEEILTRLRAEMPRMPWESSGDGFRTNQGPHSIWEIQVNYTRLGDWRGSLWHRPTGIALPVPRLPSAKKYCPIAAMHEALSVLNEWQKDISSTIMVAGLNT